MFKRIKDNKFQAKDRDNGYSFLDTKEEKRSGNLGKPILPGLESGFIEQVVKGFPIVEDLVAVVDDVGGGAHVPHHPEHRHRQDPPHHPSIVAVLLRLRLLRVLIRRGRGVLIRRRGRSPAMPRLREHHGRHPSLSYLSRSLARSPDSPLAPGMGFD